MIAIMVYYIIIYFIRKYFIKTIPVILVLVGIISLIVYCVFFPYKFETGEKGLYGITTLYIGGYLILDLCYSVLG